MIEVVGFILTAMVFLIILKILTLPFKIIIKVGLNILVGGIVLGICTALGIGIVIHWWTIALTAILGLPGFFIAALIAVIL